MAVPLTLFLLLLQMTHCFPPCEIWPCCDALGKGANPPGEETLGVKVTTSNYALSGIRHVPRRLWAMLHSRLRTLGSRQLLRPTKGGNSRCCVGAWNRRSYGWWCRSHNFCCCCRLRTATSRNTCATLLRIVLCTAGTNHAGLLQDIKNNGGCSAPLGSSGRS